MGDLLTIKEAAREFRVTAKHIYAAVKSGAIGHARAPRVASSGPRTILLVRRAELESLRADGFLRSPKYR